MVDIGDVEKEIAKKKSLYSKKGVFTDLLDDDSLTEAETEELHELAVRTFGKNHPFNRNGFLRIAEAFNEMGMEEEAVEYATKAIGGIGVISGMSDDDRKMAYQIIGESGEANKIFHDIAAKDKKRINAYRKKGELGNAYSVAIINLNESKDKSSVGLESAFKDIVEDLEGEIKEVVSEAENDYKIALKGVSYDSVTMRERID